MKKRITSLILCLCIICSIGFSSITVSAETVKKGNIIIDKVSALSGDTVIVNISTENNPGMMAMTISITYDSSVLTYDNKYYKGYLRDYMVVAHPDKNIIRFVNCEGCNRFGNGVMLGLQFKINEDADTGFYPISITYKSGDFCDWNLNKIMPEITPGGVDVIFNKEKCKHTKYGEWTTVAEPGCFEPGAKQRICKKCGHVDIAEIPEIGKHDYEENWTIDKPATEDTPGTMSRHCKRCSDKTDIIEYTLKQIQEEKIENEPGVTTPPTDLTQQLMNEQHPDSEDTISETDNNSDKGKIDNIISNIFEDSSGNSSNGKKSKSYLEQIKNYLFCRNGTGLIGRIYDAIPKNRFNKLLILFTAMSFYRILTFI